MKHQNLKRIQTLGKTILVLVVCLTPGCNGNSYLSNFFKSPPPSDYFEIYVNAISLNEKPEKKKYLIFSGMEDISPNDLQFKEFGRYVNRALKSQGFLPVKSVEEAEIAIFLSFGISDPKEEEYTYSVPIWGQTGVRSSYTQGSVHSFGNTSTFSGRTTYQPSFGITGTKTRTEKSITFLRYMVLNAFDFKAFKESEKEIQLWKTEVTSEGYSDDLRKVSPVMVAGAMPYIGKDSGEKIELNFNDRDPEVFRIKGISTERPISEKE